MAVMKDDCGPVTEFRLEATSGMVSDPSWLKSNGVYMFHFSVRLGRSSRKRGPREQAVPL